MPEAALNLLFTKTINSNRKDAQILLSEAFAHLAFLKSHGCASGVDDYYFRLSLDEALENAITHGNGDDERKTIQVIILAYETGVAITVKDEGRGYIPENLNDPREAEYLFRKNGRGVHILKNIGSVSWNEQGNSMTIRL